MQRRKLAVILIPAFALTALLPSQCLGSSSLRRLEQQFSRASRSISHLQAQLRPLKQKQKVAERDYQESSHRLQVTQRNLRDIQSQLQSTRSKLSTTLTVLQKVEKRLMERNNLLAGRLVDTYKYGTISYLDVFLGANDFWELLNGTHVVRGMVRKDSELLSQIKQDKQVVEHHKATLEEQKAKRAQLERQQRTVTAQVHQQTAECHEILKTISQQRAELEQQLAAELAASRQISAMMRRMMATPAGRKRMMTPWHGSFSMPVNGRISSPFGMRYHPILHRTKMHTGTDIAAPSGTPIHAGASGIVVGTGWYGAYGNTVVLDHGGGVITFYGHCSRLAVGSGSHVSRGQVIAYVGSTGLSTGPHVHFEVQQNGHPVSPYTNF